MKQVLFIHVPKAAGTSVERTVGRSMPQISCQKLGLGKRMRATAYDEDMQFTTFSHCSIALLVRYGVVSPRWVNSVWTCAIVRNPWDRLVSLYASINQNMRGSYHVQWNDLVWPTAPPFSEFIDVICAGAIPPVGPFPQVGLSHANPQLDWLRWDDGTIIPDYIGRFEKLEEAWRVICEHLGVSQCPSLRHRNATEHKPYREYYTPVLRDRVAKRFAEDIDTFKYAW